MTLIFFWVLICNAFSFVDLRLLGWVTNVICNSILFFFGSDGHVIGKTCDERWSCTHPGIAIRSSLGSRRHLWLPAVRNEFSWNLTRCLFFNNPWNRGRMQVASFYSRTENGLQVDISQCWGIPWLVSQHLEQSNPFWSLDQGSWPDSIYTAFHYYFEIKVLSKISASLSRGFVCGSSRFTKFSWQYFAKELPVLLLSYLLVFDSTIFRVDADSVLFMRTSMNSDHNVLTQVVSYTMFTRIVLINSSEMFGKFGFHGSVPGRCRYCFGLWQSTLGAKLCCSIITACVAL